MKQQAGLGHVVAGSTHLTMLVVHTRESKASCFSSTPIVPLGLREEMGGGPCR